jgi:hypothetical protein
MKFGGMHEGAVYLSVPTPAEGKEFLREAGLAPSATRWECPCGKMWGGLDWNKRSGWYAFYATK